MPNSDHVNIDDRLSVEWLIVADRAEIQGGKLYLMGGGWDRLQRDEFPAPYEIFIAFAVRVPWGLTNEDHTFQLTVLDDDGNQLQSGSGGFNVGRSPQARPGQVQRMQMVASVSVTFPAAGGYEVAALIDEEVMQTFPFHVTLRAGATQRPAAN